MKDPKTFQEAILIFANEQVCIDAVAALRWPDGKQECPKCGAKDSHYYLKTQRRWKCKSCRNQFSVKVNTIFEDSAISLTKWLPALWQIVNCKNGISSYELASAIGVTQKTAWFMLHRLRLVMKTGTITKIGGNGAEVEADETYIGAKAITMHKSRKQRIYKAYNELTNTEQKGLHRVGSLPNKTTVTGVLDRETRQVRAQVAHRLSREVLQNRILDTVAPGSKLYTDESQLYAGIEKKFVHEVVNHLSGYVRGRVHTNGIENFWSLLKRGLRGTYVAVEPFHLDRYVDEQVFRYNNRATKDNPLTNSDRFTFALSQIANKRLTFAELTGKTGSKANF